MFAVKTIVALLLVVSASACGASADTIAPASHTSTPVVAAVPASATAAEAVPEATPGTPGRLDIVVTDKGFEPDKLKVKKGTATKLAFTRKTERTCAKEVILQLGGGKTIERALPLGETVVIEATFAQSGELRYACSMDMITGVISVE